MYKERRIIAANGKPTTTSWKTHSITYYIVALPGDFLMRLYGGGDEELWEIIFVLVKPLANSKW